MSATSPRATKPAAAATRIASPQSWIVRAPTRAGRAMRSSAARAGPSEGAMGSPSVVEAAAISSFRLLGSSIPDSLAGAPDFVRGPDVAPVVLEEELRRRAADAHRADQLVEEAR